MADMLVRSHSGSQGYVGITNGLPWSISDISTVTEMKKAGHYEISIKDADFTSLVNTARLKEKALKSIVALAEKG